MNAKARKAQTIEKPCYRFANAWRKISGSREIPRFSGGLPDGKSNFCFRRLGWQKPFKFFIAGFDRAAF